MTKRYVTLRQELSARAQFILSVDNDFYDFNKRRPKELLNTSIVRIYK